MKRARILSLAAAALILDPRMAVAFTVPTAPPPVEAYGQLPAIDHVSLSPSGNLLALDRPVQGLRKIVVEKTDGTLILTVNVGDESIRYIDWVDDKHFILTTSVTRDEIGGNGREEFTLYRNVNLKTRSAKVIFDKNPIFWPYFARLFAVRVIGGVPFAFLSNIPKEGVGIGHLIATADSATFNRYYPDLWRVNLDTDEITRVARGIEFSNAWAVDTQGQVAAVANFYPSTNSWMLFRGEKLLMKVQSARDLVELWGLGRTPGSDVVLDKSGPQTRLREFSNTGEENLIADDVPISYPIHDHKTGLLVGYRTDSGKLVFFDSALQARIDAATQPFPGLKLQEGVSDDVSKVVIESEGLGSGTHYLVDLNRHAADIIGDDYPNIPPEQVGEIRRYAYRAADGQALDGILSLPAGRAAHLLSLVVLPHGGPIGIADEPKFDWLAQAFASRGYAVFQPNYRGSGLHGAAFETAGYGEYGRKMLSDIADGVAALTKDGLIDSHRVAIVGFSYGGYAALAGVTVQQNLYRCAVSGSGISDLPAMLRWVDDRWGGASGVANDFREILGTSVPGAPPLPSISPARLAERADAPILLIHGKDDSVVPIVQSQIMERALRGAGKPVQTLYTEKEDHWLSHEATRISTLKAALAFVEQYNPPN